MANPYRRGEDVGATESVATGRAVRHALLIILLQRITLMNSAVGSSVP